LAHEGKKRKQKRNTAGEPRDVATEKFDRKNLGDVIWKKKTLQVNRLP